MKVYASVYSFWVTLKSNVLLFLVALLVLDLVESRLALLAQLLDPQDIQNKQTASKILFGCLCHYRGKAQ